MLGLPTVTSFNKGHMENRYKHNFQSHLYHYIYMHLWRAVTSESGHAICMPKSDHENRYVMGVRL